MIKIGDKKLIEKLVNKYAGKKRADFGGENIFKGQPGFDEDPALIEDLLSIAVNERKFYESGDVEGAVDYAIKNHTDSTMQSLKEDCETARPYVVKELKNYWAGEDR